MIPHATLRFLPVLLHIPRWHTTYLGGKNTRDHPPDRVLELSIDRLLVRSSEWAHRPNSPPQPQLQCIGGSASDKTRLQPREMYLRNRGPEGGHHKPVWDFEVNELGKRVRVDDVVVNWERWDGPDDPYVRAGSAIVTYKLTKVSPLASASDDEWIGVVFLIVIVVALVALHEPGGHGGYYSGGGGIVVVSGGSGGGGGGGGGGTRTQGGYAQSSLDE